MLNFSLGKRNRSEWIVLGFENADNSVSPMGFHMTS